MCWLSTLTIFAGQVGDQRHLVLAPAVHGTEVEDPVPVVIATTRHPSVLECYNPAAVGEAGASAPIGGGVVDGHAGPKTGVVGVTKIFRQGPERLGHPAGRKLQIFVLVQSLDFAGQGAAEERKQHQKIQTPHLAPRR